MQPSAQFLRPSEAAARLGVSTKALRLYESLGFLPSAQEAGAVAYGTADVHMALDLQKAPTTCGSPPDTRRVDA